MKFGGGQTRTDVVVRRGIYSPLQLPLCDTPEDEKNAGERNWTLNRQLTRLLLYHWATPAKKGLAFITNQNVISQLQRVALPRASWGTSWEASIGGSGGFGVVIGVTCRWKKDDILLTPDKTWADPIDLFWVLDSQHFLNFFPDPQEQGSFLPIFSISMQRLYI